jgi:hypothetical protein
VFLSLSLMEEYIEYCSLQQCLPSRFTRNVVKVSARTRGIRVKQGKKLSAVCRGRNAVELVKITAKDLTLTQKEITPSDTLKVNFG